MAIANGAFRTPPVVANLLIINILVFLAEILLPGRISNALLEFGALSFWKGGDFHIWQRKRMEKSQAMPMSVHLRREQHMTGLLRHQYM